MPNPADRTARVPTALTAEEFIATNQSTFGTAWRYELVNGVIEGQAAPTPAHGVILANLAFTLKARLDALGGDCRAETGSAAAPARTQRSTARIPDALVRCKGLPRVTFEIVSPSELRQVRERDRKREDVKDVDGVVQIVEIYQHTMAAHVHAKAGAGVWGLVPVSGEAAAIDLGSIGISIPLAGLYENAMPADEVEPGHEE